jgi:hypothetical protein
MIPSTLLDAVGYGKPPVFFDALGAFDAFGLFLGICVVHF